MTDSATAPSPRPPHVGHDDEISLWEVLAVVVRRRGTIVFTTLLVMAGAVAFTQLGRDSFTTSAAFRPQGSESSPSELLALATQFGVNVGSGASDEASPDFYVELLTSRQILSEIAAEPYDVSGVGSTSLADLLEIEDDTEPLRQERVINWLRETAVTVKAATTTGTVSLEVETEWPDLSKTIAERLLDSVTRFNLDTRQSQAAAERKFIEALVDSAHAELQNAEDELQAFLESNRQWEDAPALVVEKGRFDRDIALKNALLTQLLQLFDQARIAEVRDTPVITVLQEPYMPPGPDERSLVLALALGVVLGGMMGVVSAFIVEAVRRPAEGDPARLDFQESWAGLMRSIPLVGRRWS